SSLSPLLLLVDELLRRLLGRDGAARRVIGLVGHLRVFRKEPQAGKLAQGVQQARQDGQFLEHARSLARRSRPRKAYCGWAIQFRCANFTLSGYLPRLPTAARSSPLLTRIVAVEDSAPTAIASPLIE